MIKIESSSKSILNIESSHKTIIKIVSSYKTILNFEKKTILNIEEATKLYENLKAAKKPEKKNSIRCSIKDVRTEMSK